MPCTYVYVYIYIYIVPSQPIAKPCRLCVLCDASLRIYDVRSKTLQAQQIMAAARQNKTLMKRKTLKVNGKQETLRIDSNIKEHEMADQ